MYDTYAYNSGRPAGSYDEPGRLLEVTRPLPAEKYVQRGQHQNYFEMSLTMLLQNQNIGRRLSACTSSFTIIQ